MTGYYLMKGNKANTKAGRKDLRYIEAFDWLRDMEFPISQSRAFARDVVRLMDAHPDWDVRYAFQEALK